ncbi:MAG TPA: hypothetical protein VG604_04245 [Candidatus Saccharimonadales bacterium]|nr:hypothetical protein [Candidatus Saccharimonadales bacterium]
MSDPVPALPDFIEEVEASGTIVSSIGRTVILENIPNDWDKRAISSGLAKPWQADRDQDGRFVFADISQEDELTRKIYSNTAPPMMGKAGWALAGVRSIYRYKDDERMKIHLTDECFAEETVAWAAETLRKVYAEREKSGAKLAHGAVLAQLDLNRERATRRNEALLPKRDRIARSVKEFFGFKVADLSSPAVTKQEHKAMLARWKALDERRRARLDEDQTAL